MTSTCQRLSPFEAKTSNLHSVGFASFSDHSLVPPACGRVTPCFFLPFAVYYLKVPGDFIHGGFDENDTYTKRKGRHRGIPSFKRAMGEREYTANQVLFSEKFEAREKHTFALCRVVFAVKSSLHSAEGKHHLLIAHPFGPFL